MKTHRIRIYSRVNRYWNPCVKAFDVSASEGQPLVSALNVVGAWTGGIISYTMTPIG